MNKHALMLTAAAVALMAGQALAAGPTTITTKVTDQQKTSTDGDITVGTGGSVVVTTAGPAIEIDSANTVNNSVVGALISNLNTTNAIGVQLDATAAGTNGSTTSTPAFDNFGTIDLSGTGATKTGILVKAIDGAGSSFNGDIKFESGSTTKVQGDSSFGLQVAQDAKLNGNITIAGSLLVQASSTTSTAASNVIAMDILGNVIDNIDIKAGGTVEGIGQGAQGLLISGNIGGSLTNGGGILSVGTATPAITGGNPEAGSALVISGSIAQGVLNDGPSAASPGTSQASIAMQGSAQAAVLIGPGVLGATTPTTLTIGQKSDDTNNPDASFLNRGSINAQSENPNHTEQAILLTGGSAAHVDLSGGFFNSGTIGAAATSDGKQQVSFSATALHFGQFVDVNTLGHPSNGGTGSVFALVNSNISGSGTISANVSGSTGGVATAVEIDPNATIDSIQNSGTISASASTTDTTISSLSAFAIFDGSGTLNRIDNSGRISAVATTLDKNNQIAIAVSLSSSTTNVRFTNSGSVTGNINFGVGNDVLEVNGSAGGSVATVVGDIAFGGTPDPSNSSNFDTLTIGTNGKGIVSGAVTETAGSRVKVTIGNQGSLTLTNKTTSLVASDLSVADGGILNISLSNGFNQAADATNPALITAHTITFDQLSALNVSVGSFISTPDSPLTQFTLFNADGSIALNNPAAIKNSIEKSINSLFLFNGSVCGYHITNGFTNDSGCAPGPSTPALIVNLVPKTADKIGLTGSAKEIFSQVNKALAKDDSLGAAIVTDVTDKQSAQKAYASFVPDLSGSTRAVAISITDQATGPVGARQRALRMYAAQPGGATLWGQEFVQRLNSNGDADAFRASGFGFALGVDDGDPRNGRYGAALTFFSGDQTNKGPNFTKTTNEWYMLSGYTDWRGKGLFVDSQITAGYGTLNGKRFLRLTDPNDSTIVFKRTARSRRKGLLAAGGISTGAVFTYGSTVITPQLSVDGLTVREEGYTETGGGSVAGGDGFDLKVQPYYASSVRGYFGTTLREDLNLGDFFIQPEIRGGYRYEFLTDPVRLRTTFKSLIGTPDSQFTLTGPDLRRGTVVGGATIAVTTGAWSLGVNYDYLRGGGGSVSQVGTVTLVGRL